MQAAGTILELHRADSSNARHISLRDFYLGNRRVAMAENEILVGVHIPLPNSSSQTFLRSYKQARRRDDAVGIVSAGLQVQLEQSETVMAKKTEQELIGLPWTRTTIDTACELILQEMLLDELSPGGQPEYRYDALLFERNR